MRNLFIIVILLSQWQVNAQTIGTNQAIEDLEFLRKSIIEYNPALSKYHPEFDSLSIQVIEKPHYETVSILEHFTKINKICALANEGHINIGDRNDNFYKEISDNTKISLPIQIKIIDSRIYIYGDFSNEQLLNRGDEVITINGISSKNILNKLMEVTSSDGNIKTYAFRKIEDTFSSIFYYHIQQCDVFTIKTLDKDNKEKSTTLKALTTRGKIDNIKKYYPPKDVQKNEAESFYTLTLNSDYAYLKLPSFDYRKVNKYQVKSKKLYKSIFEELQNENVNHLIIDLRDNTGGRNEFADDIIPFIIQDDNNDSFLKKTISWNGKTKTYRLPKPSKLLFKGSIYVLVNGKTFSAGSTLARYLKEYGNAICIGTETGTRYEGFAAGSSETVILPYSKISIGIPRYHIVFPKSIKQQTANRGLLLDYEIQSTIEDYSNKVDLHLDKAISLLKQ